MSSQEPAPNVREYRSGQEVLGSRPQYLLVELTRQCNLRCPMCRDEPVSGTHTMTDALFERVVELVHPGMCVDLRGCGESLVLPGIRDRIRAVSGRAGRLRFVSNLSFRRPGLMEFLVEHGVWLAASVDSADSETLKEVRGGADIGKIVQNLREFSTALCARGLEADRLTLTVTVQARTVATLAGLADLAQRNGVPEIRLFAVTGPCGAPYLLDGHQDRVEDALDRLRVRAQELGVRVYLGTRLGRMSERSPGAQACIHPWCFAAIAFDGGVCFCDHLVGPAMHDYTMGDLTRSRFEAIWNGERWRQLRRLHRSERSQLRAMYEECSWCYQHRHLDFEHWFLPELAANRIELTAKRRSSHASAGSERTT